MSVALAMIALRASTFEVKRAHDFLRAKWPRQRIGEIVSDESGVGFDLDDDFAAFSLVDAPIPWSDIEGPCATAREWPRAAEEMRTHSAHLLVAVAGDEDRGPATIARRLRLTRALAAAAAASPAVGVYWGEAKMIHEPSQFVARAIDATADDLPIGLWVDIRHRDEPLGRRTYFTTGMKALGHREIEIVRTRTAASDLHPLLLTLIDYLLENGPVLRDGETFGRSGEERIVVRIAKSVFNRDEVLRLQA